MRMSDWSADVCSSDLRAAAADDPPDGLLDDSDHQPAAARCVVVAHQLRLRQRGDGAGRARLRPDAPAALPVCHRRLHAALRGGAGGAGGIPPSRKDVVIGNSVVVCLYLGGPRIIKKKKTI